MNQPFDPAAASGESNYKGAQGLTLNEVSLNGDGDVREVSPGQFIRKGGFFRKRILIGAKKDEKPEEENLGNPVSVVFLKIRRKLVQRGADGKIVRSTSEHNDKSDAVLLYEAGKQQPESGVAADLREKYEGLRTVQVVYALLLGHPTEEPELVRITIKGASLGSESKADDRTDFYSYLGSFKGDDHFYQYETLMEAVLENGKKTYFATNFKRGSKLSENNYAYAMNKMRLVHEKCMEVDTTRAARIAKGATVEIPDAPEDVAGVDYPKDDINPDDIPF